MHPVKAEEAIARSLFQARRAHLLARHRWRSSRRSCAPRGGASDLTLCVRLRVSSDHAKLSLAAKFGAEPDETKALLFAARQAADALGICFHVGSQAMTPARLCRGAGARPRGDRRGGGHGRRRRRRRRLPVDLSRHGAAAARGLFRRDPRARSRACRSAIRPSCGASRAARCAPNMRACWSASSSAAATSSTSTTAPMARCSMRRISAGASR